LLELETPAVNHAHVRLHVADDVQINNALRPLVVIGWPHIVLRHSCGVIQWCVRVKKQFFILGPLFVVPSVQFLKQEEARMAAPLLRCISPPQKIDLTTLLLTSFASFLSLEFGDENVDSKTGEIVNTLGSPTGDLTHKTITLVSPDTELTSANSTLPLLPRNVALVLIDQL